MEAQLTLTAKSVQGEYVLSMESVHKSVIPLMERGS
jgi:hypothetical protein